ncbi:MAG: hypothetical protein WKG00_33915 [Polyangiaceae bacterium]
MKLLADVTPAAAARVFAVSNVAFLGVDIALAHMANAFAHPGEWAPIVFSALATLLLVPGALGQRGRLPASLDLVAGWGAVVVGVVGMVFHLESGFFTAQTLHNLVYSAPFVAPLSYVGLGLLILLLRSEEADKPALGPWLLLLSLGGFVGNYGLSVLDHAQNGFFQATEWIPVASAALAIGILAVTLATRDARVRLACLAIMGGQVVVGVAGFVLHVTADLNRPAASALDRFVFGAPAFAPLLFADLAALAAIGIWALRGTTERAPAPRSGPSGAVPAPTATD